MAVKDMEIVKEIDADHQVIREENGNLYFRKLLRVYNTDVYAWLKEHPSGYFPKVLSYEETGKGLLVKEEYVNGKPLNEVLPFLSEGEKAGIFSEVLEAVSYLHQANPPIVHRDIKEENILVMKDGCVKLCDYNAAKIVQKNEPRDTVLIGTEGLAAPEQYGFGSSDERTDIYALGILIRDMFPGDKHMLKVADRCTQLKPEDRYQSIDELKTDMKRRIHFHINIPGFRTGNPRNMFIAITAYLFIFYVILNMNFTSKDGAVITDLAYIRTERLVYILILFAYVDLFTGWTGIYSHLLWMKSKKRVLKVLGYLLASIWILVIGAIVLLLVETTL